MKTYGLDKTTLPIYARIAAFTVLHGAAALYLMPGWQHAIIATAMFALIFLYFEIKERRGLSGSHVADIFLLIYYARYAVPPFFAPWFCAEPIHFNGLYLADCESVYSSSAMMYLLAGQAVFSLLVLLYWPRFPKSASTVSVSITVGEERLGLLCFGIFFAIALLPVIYPPFAAVTSLNQIFAPSAYLALAILITYVLESKRYWPLKLAALAMFAAYMLKLTSGSILTPVLTTLLIAFLVYYRKSNQLSLKWLAVIALIFVTAYPATGHFRDYDWYDKKFEDSTIPEKAYAYIAHYVSFNVKTVSCFMESGDGSGDCFLDGRLNLMLQRLAHLPHATRAMAVTPETIDYWAGESYKPLLFSLVPRALYPDKPQEVLGSYFNTDYWLSRTEGMSMNLPVEVEAYLNFGKLGFVLSPALIALVFIGIYRLPLGKIPEGANLKLILALPLVFPDGNLSLIFGNAIKFMVLFAVLLVCVRWSLDRLKPSP